MPKKKKEETFEITPFGILTVYLGLTEEKSDRIIDELELVGRRKGYKNPALLLNGRESELVEIRKK